MFANVPVGGGLLKTSENPDENHSFKPAIDYDILERMCDTLNLSEDTQSFAKILNGSDELRIKASDRLEPIPLHKLETVTEKKGVECTRCLTELNECRLLMYQSGSDKTVLLAWNPVASVIFNALQDENIIDRWPAVAERMPNATETREIDKWHPLEEYFKEIGREDVWKYLKEFGPPSSIGDRLSNQNVPVREQDTLKDSQKQPEHPGTLQRKEVLPKGSNESVSASTVKLTVKLETATFGAGCFWCVEAVFQQLEGVHAVVSGYTGGTTVNPNYQAVCMGMTGHAEVIQIQFDPTVISYEELLEVLWHTHDATTLNQQGADVGTQYRSAIFYHSEEQQRIAEQSKSEMDTSDMWTIRLSQRSRQLTPSTPLKIITKTISIKFKAAVLPICNPSEDAKIHKGF